MNFFGILGKGSFVGVFEPCLDFGSCSIPGPSNLWCIRIMGMEKASASDPRLIPLEHIQHDLLGFLSTELLNSVNCLGTFPLLLEAGLVYSCSLELEPYHQEPSPMEPAANRKYAN